MKKILQQLLVAALALSMIGCGSKKEEEPVTTAPASSDKKEMKEDKKVDEEIDEVDEEKTAEEDEPLTPKQQKEKAKESGALADKDKFPSGEYFIVRPGLHVRKRTTVESTPVMDSFPVGTCVEFSSTKSGVDDPTTIWGKINSPVEGWLCIADYDTCYLMNKQEWEESSLKDKTEIFGFIIDDSEIDDESKADITNSDGSVTINVKVEWSKDALENKDQVDSLSMCLTDYSGPTYVSLSEENDWSQKFMLRKGTTFTCELDTSDYPFIINCDARWNVSTCEYIFTIH